MRITAGKHKGRTLVAPSGGTVRPTSDRARQAVFNILSHGRFGGPASPLIGARVLDAFCGTGAMGLEALSRGAAEAAFLDSDPAALAAAKTNAERLGETARTRLLRSDATRPGKPNGAYDLIFLDPPYGSGLGATALAKLDEGGWIADEAVVVVEVSAKERFTAPDGFAIADERQYGAARIVLLVRA